MDTSSLMEQILSSDNLNRAYLQVVRNKGAEGVDGMKYTELKEHLAKNGENIKEQLRTRKYKPQPVRRVEIPKPDGGVRNLGVGTIGNFGVISKELDNSVCSDNVLCFHLPNDYIPNVYALYFNSSIINELTNRMSRGSVQQRMNQETLRELIIPYIKYDTQIELNEIILCSFELMNKSKRLLECAKKAVEMAIEIDEFTAFQWLEDSMRK